MISSRKELEFYIKAVRMANRGVFTSSMKTRLISLLEPDYVMQWLYAMRYAS